MEFIEIEYNRDLKPLENLLSSVKRPGDFFDSCTMELPMPKVEIDGVGTRPVQMRLQCRRITGHSPGECFEDSAEV